MTLSRLKILAATLTLACALPTAARSVWDEVASSYFHEGYSFDNIEGVWQFPDDGATLLIKRTSASTFDIMLLDSPHLIVTDPITIGKAATAPTKNTYNARLSASSLADKRLKDNDIKLTITEVGMLSLSPYHHKLKLHLRRWIPYFFRVGIERGEMPDGLIGASRLYPLTTLNYKPSL